MLIFGHAGLTLGAALLLAGSGMGSHSSQNGEVTPGVESTDHSKTPKALRIESLAHYVDLRLLLVGSLLPDLIDKPIGELFLRGTFNNGRIFGHTLIFLAIITTIGFYQYRHNRKTWLLTFSFGTFTHIVFDQMWRNPHTLLWPAYGLSFPKVEVINWTKLLVSPQAYLPELAGAAILIWFAQLLARKRSIFAFLRYGKV